MHKENVTESEKLIINSTDVDSILFATITGDLGEVLVNQPYEHPNIANQGYWNDTFLPRTFYLGSQEWDLTEAEIIGGIDAAIIGKKILTNTMRLSQLLDMYYSEKGHQLEFKVTNRSKSLNYLLDNTNLPNQIYGSTKLLLPIRGNYHFTLSDSYIQQLSELHATLYKNTAKSIANKYDNTEYINEKRLRANLEVIIILDGTFDSYSTQQMLYTLFEAIDVSYYGSQVGIINGQTGTWITNVTSEIFQIYRSFQTLDREGTWPVTLSLGRSLETALAYYQNRTRIDCTTKALRPFGQALVVFHKDGRLTTADKTRTSRSVETIKQTYPQITIVYVSEDVDGNLKKLSQNEDDSIVKSSTNAHSTVTSIIEKLSVIPASLIKFYCNQLDVLFHHYLTPGKENFFQIHREYIKRGYINTKFINKDYGDLSICFFTSRTAENNRECQRLTVNSEISFNSGRLCTPDSTCDLQYSLTANTSRMKCADLNCRYPDQVLVVITYTISSGTWTLATSFSILSALIVVLYNFRVSCLEGFN
ncbi:hypothetical protein ABEB36_011142 [Hypothenemus hampei]